MSLGALTPVRRGGGLFYGWWIVLAFGLLQFIGAGFYYYGLGNFFLPLIAEFGWSRTLTSSAYSLDRLLGIFTSPLAGFSFDRFGPRRLVAFGVLCVGAGFVLMSLTNSFLVFAVSICMISTGFAFGFAQIGMATASNWFVKRRTIAIGLLMAGAGAGGLLVPLLATMIESLGWRQTALIIGIVFWVVGLPLSRIVRHRPEQYGLLPDGAPPDVSVDESESPSQSIEKAAQQPAGLTVREALKTRTFWLLTIAIMLNMASQNAVAVHTIPYLTGVGLPSALAAGAVAAMTVVSVFGRIGFGYVADRFEKRLVMAGLLLLQVAGLLAFSFVTEVWHLIPFLALYAPGYGGGIPLRPSMQAEYFGRRNLGAIQGILVGVTSVGSMIGPVFAGWVFDQTGSYQMAFFILIGLTFLAIPLIMALPARQQPKPVIVEAA